VIRELVDTTSIDSVTPTGGSGGPRDLRPSAAK
jgi:hypothetical protein